MVINCDKQLLVKVYPYRHQAPVSASAGAGVFVHP